MKPSFAVATAVSALGATVAMFDLGCDQYASCSNAKDGFYEGVDFAGGTYVNGFGTIVAHGTALA